jgi:predicted O-linked N-acetylglucosamine transferase (SPINDLY family)
MQKSEIDKLLAIGANHHKKGDLPKAEANYRAILSVDPHHGDANHLMGLLAKQVGKFDVAGTFLSAALQSNPQNALYLSNGVKLFLQVGDPEAALNCIENASPPYSVDVLFLRAVALQNLNRLEDAAKQLRDILEETPNFAPAHNGLCMLYRLQGALELAIDHGQTSTALAPENAEFHYQLGLAFAQQKNTAQAKESLTKATDLKPNLAAANSALGNQLIFAGEINTALEKLKRAVELSPQSSEFHNDLGHGYYVAGNLEEAEKQFSAALEIDPDYAEAHGNIGVVLRELNRTSEALAHNLRAVELSPNSANLHNNLGNAYHRSGMLVEAKAEFVHAVELAANHGEAYGNLCVVLRKLGELDGAISAGQHAVQNAPHAAQSHNSLGVALHLAGQLLEAETCFKKAIALDPSHAKAHSNLASLYKDFGNFEQAQHHFEQALKHDENFCTAFSNMLFTMNYAPNKTGEEIFKWYQEFNQRYAAPLKVEQKPHQNDRTIDRKLRIGYVSSTLCKHAAAYHLPPLFEQANKDDFELFAYADLSTSDEYTQLYKSNSDCWITTNGMSDADLADKIRADQIDILIDISGHAKGNRLLTFARRPAPVSLHWLDFGYTTGMDAIDYYLGDENVTPERDDHLFGEREVWRLDGPSVVYRPGPDMGEVSPLPAKQNGFVTFCTLSRSVRLNEKTIKVWADILKRVDGSKLRLDSRNYQDPMMCDQVAEKFAKFGIERDRLIMGFNSPPWDVLREIDIALDCFPHNSGTTLFEHLYMGNPYVTLYNRASVGTLGGAILRHAGFGEWVAQSEDEYVDLAVNLASDLDKLADIRATMRAKMEDSPAMDEEAFVTRMENAYRQMWKRYCEAET